MGCGVSKTTMAIRKKRTLVALGGGGERRKEGDVVRLCEERVRLVKKSVKNRGDFAQAHYSYLHSLSSLSSALSVFLSHYSSSPTFEEEEAGRDCGAYADAGEWDFFTLLDGKEEKRESLKQCENAGKRKGREWLEGMKDVQDYFARAVQAGVQVARMLELDLIHSHQNSQEKSVCRRRSILSRSLSCKSFLSRSSRSPSSSWTESGGDHKSLLSSSDNSSVLSEDRSDPIEGHWGMVSGSHSSTLGRLYAWEKKLYHEVKAGDLTWKAYKRKCSQLLQKKIQGDDFSPSKATSEANSLYHLMLITLQHAQSISKQIDKLRDEELQPQVFELLQGLMTTWKSMWETHEIQKKIMREIKSFSCPDLEKFSGDSHRLATLQLEAAMRSWHSCFSEYISTQKAYVKSLHGWLSKFIDAEAEHYYKGSSLLPPVLFNGPTLLVICHNWLTMLERLPDEAVNNDMKRLAEGIQGLSVQQGINMKQKRNVDGLAKEMDRKILTVVQKAEDKTLILKHSAQSIVKDRVESPDEKKDQLEVFMEKVEMEKQRYHSSVQETERATMHRLQMGFSSVFESLADFSRASVKVYADLITFSQNAKVQQGQAFVYSSKYEKRGMKSDTAST